MEEAQITSVAAVLAEWNPLGSKASDIPDLDGYRTEGIDIIMALSLRGKAVPAERTVSDVLNQAFKLSLTPIECIAAARKIQSILQKDR